MILYRLNKGIIQILSVVRETPTGWRRKDNGFINKCRLSEKRPSLTGYYYTTSLGEAKMWSKTQRQILADYSQAAMGAYDDVEFWQSCGMHEEDIPKPRD
jgi:hypothetical protein